MDIKNKENGKFIYNDTTTEISFSRLEAEFISPMRVLIESKLNGNRSLKNKNTIAVIKFKIGLFKEENKESKALNYNFYLGKDVILYPWKDGEAMHNEFGKPVYFTLTNANFFFENTPEYEDLLILTFESKENVVMSYVERFGYGVKYSTQYGKRL